MISMRIALTDRLEAMTELQQLNVNIIQEDQLNEDTILPAVVLAYTGKRPYRGSEIITREGWALSILTKPGEYYTLGLIGSAMKRDLDRTYLNPPPDMVNLGEAGMEIEWVLDGPTQLDMSYSMHTQVQYYEIIVQDY